MVGAERLGSIGQYPGAVAFGDARDPRVVGASAEQVHRHYGWHRSSFTVQLVEHLLQEDRVHLPGLGVGVDEVRGRPGVGDGIGSRCECHRRGGNDVAGADSPGQQTEVEGSGTGAQGDGVAASEAVGHLLLEGVHVGTERGDPS